jgi:PPOX class probable F420-dependent enzyme
MFEPAECGYIETARIGRLATADTKGRPHVVPVCFALVDDEVVTPIDEKPQDVLPDALRRSRNIRENPHVALVVDHYTEEWSQLGWVQVRGTATHLNPGDPFHADAVVALQEKYDQYTTHALDDRPVIRLTPRHVRSWGQLDPPGDTPS